MTLEDFLFTYKVEPSHLEDLSSLPEGERGEIRRVLRENKFFEDENSLRKRTELSPEQLLFIEEFKEEVREIMFGGNTDIEEEKLQRGVNIVYEEVGQSPPKIVITDSPKGALEYLESKGLDKAAYLHGSLDLFWMAAYKLSEAFGQGNKNTKTLEALWDISTQCEWWWAFEGLCVVSRKCSQVMWDEYDCLHSSTGPAIRYIDGFSLYAWHGVDVPQRWIDEGPTVEEAFNEENVEMRRVAFEILGWDKVLENLDTKILDEDKDPMIGSLLQVDLPGLGEEVFLKVKCGTGRDNIVLPVPPDMKSAKQANAWLQHMGEEELNLEFRT